LLTTIKNKKNKKDFKEDLRMAIKREGTEKKEVSFKGIFRGYSDDGFHIEDMKSGEKEVLFYDEFKKFIGKEVKFGMVETKKKALDVE
jgi:hypothetical protein